MENKQNTTAGSETRRDFIKKAATLTAAAASTNLFRTPVYGQTTAPSAGRVIGANDRITIGHIGLGLQGFGAHGKLLKAQAGSANIVQTAVCDLWSKRMDTAKAFLEADGGAKVQTYDDYRKLLEQKDIDAVVIATHDIWHTQLAKDALNAGKHVYLEKPLSRYLGEAFDLFDTVKSTKKCFQVGSQGCSAAGWHKAAEIIKAGKIGPMVWGQGYYCRNNPKGEWNYAIDTDAKADNVKWDAWLGQVKKRSPFDADHFFRWRKYYPYCAGLLGDLMPHRLHPLMVATGSPEFPTRVSTVSTSPVGTDKKTPGTYKRDVPEHIELIAEFPSGLTLMCACSTVNAKSPGFVIYGHHAILEIGNMGERIKYTPEKEFTDEYEQEEFTGLQPTEDISVHQKNWLDCIRNGKEPNANIDLAVRVQTVISLAEMADRLKIAACFDEKTRKVYTGEGAYKKEIQPITYGTLELS